MVSSECLLLTSRIAGIEGTQSRFQGGDGIGIWISTREVSDDMTQADVARNKHFMQTAGGLVSDPRTKISEGNDMHIYAYHPWTDSVPDNGLYRLDMPIDLIWASALRPSSTAVTDTTCLNFHHLMSRLVLNIHGDADEPGALEGCKAELMNALSSSVVDMGNGTIATTGEKARIEGGSQEPSSEEYEASSVIICAPQTFKAGEEMLRITTQGNVPISWTPNEDFTVAGGHQTTLDVLVHESECEVQVRDIEEWTTAGSVISGVAHEELPEYHLFDYYERNGVEGIVVYVDDTNTHGWIVSTDQTYLPLANTDLDPMETYLFTSVDDSKYNMEQMKALDPTLSSFPSAQWCEAKNVDGITGWVLPAFNVLRTFGELLFGNDSEGNRTAFDTAIMGAPVETSKKTTLAVVDWSDMSATTYYGGSTISALTNRLRTVGMEVYDIYYGSGTGISTTTTLPTSTPCFVRAFHEF